MTLPSATAARRSSIDTAHWSSRESLVGSVADKSLMDATSPTSSITEHSASGVVNVLKIAQDWQQKQQEKLKKQEQQQAEEQAREQSPPLQESRVNVVEEENKRQEGEAMPENITNSSNNLDSSDGLALILEPKDLYQRNILSNEETQELFVDMCFYARLGFVQPPCCLLCTYQESMEGASPNKTCTRWVIWRRNAETALHPHQLDGNILVTKCHVAQALLQGETVGGYDWDTDSKKVVLCCSASS